MSSQQLAAPVFDRPGDLVSWMGAMQAQDYPMSKWAVGVRLKPATTVRTVEKSLEKGEILRTHVMRPTWHLVAAEDIRWMLTLSAPHLKTVARSREKMLEITESLFIRSNRVMEKALEGNRHLTRQELAQALGRAGVVTDSARMNHFLMRAEVEGLICSGVDRERKATYALLEERAAPVRERLKEEALAGLAEKYFRSHSPASLHDFAWWSGLSVVEARQAIRLIEPSLVADRFGGYELFIHHSCRESHGGDVLHFLPSFDEYIISYKDRASVLAAKHHSGAFSRQGMFYPIIVYNGEIIGTWSRTLKKGHLVISSALFEKRLLNEALCHAAINRYKYFVSVF
jgi:hypothetical protein